MKRIASPKALPAALFMRSRAFVNQQFARRGNGLRNAGPALPMQLCRRSSRKRKRRIVENLTALPDTIRTEGVLWTVSTMQMRANRRSNVPGLPGDQRKALEKLCCVRQWVSFGPGIRPATACAGFSACGALRVHAHPARRPTGRPAQDQRKALPANCPPQCPRSSR